MEDDERYVPIDPRALSPEALRGVIEEYVSREGTDYGLVEASFEKKVEDVERQLASGEARIVFDAVEETVHIVPVKGKR
jgi:uncharacterized protein YheU (UPF0270 family)